MAQNRVSEALLESERQKQAMLGKVDAVLQTAGMVVEYWQNHNPHNNGVEDFGVETRLAEALDKLTDDMSELRKGVGDVWNFLNTSKTGKAKQKTTRRTKAKK